MILVECKPDYALVSKLTSLSRRKIEHSSGKTAVLGKLIRRRRFSSYENSFGIIDEDPMSYQPRIITEFAEWRNVSDCRIRILYYKWLNNYVVVLCPRLEEWIIEAAKESGISLNDYGLPNEPEALHQIINLNIDNFEKLIDALKERSPSVNKLKQCIEGQF
jgi:hypothetical protein